MRLHRFIITSCVALIIGATTSNYSLIAQRPMGIAGLADNTEYQELMRHNSELSDSIDSLTYVMNDVRNNLRDRWDSGVERTSEQRDSISKLIIGLEQRIFDLRDERGIVTNRINSIEQEWVLSQFNNPSPTPVEDSWADPIEESVVVATNYRNLIDNSCFTEEMSAADYTMLRRAHAAESEISEKIAEYLSRHESMRNVAEEYMTTDSEVTADSLYTAFETLKQHNEAMNNYIEALWHEIIDTKQYSFSYVLEKKQQHELLDRMTEEFAAMQRAYGDYEDYYASNAIMHYAIGHPTLLDTELSIARAMDISAAADSLSTVAKSLQMPEYRIEDIELEIRLFIDYEPIIFGKTSFYNNTNPIPQLKVYERGTIYRILLGRFRSMQNLTIFKGVQPLYIVREDNMYSYYAGGYATLTEADEAAQMLRNKGFRAPQVCRWEDGTMTNLTKEAEGGESKDKPAETTANDNVRYMVEIASDSISGDVQATIEAVAPGKRISRAGNKFVVGPFVERSEANTLVDSLKAMFEELEVTTKEISLN
ncbi:MAG: hypothetical protein IKW52_01535 [Alistipes sp.]|nr:hypothetical protein [Alistipes sp.]